MKMAGLVLVVVGLAAWTINVCFFDYVDTVDMLQNSMFVPVSRLAILMGLGLLALHAAVRFLWRVINH
ncbi:DUF3955 domain-containing protein [Martelella alba]|uniref:DUF3955 domain-containing protein n=1 Tax=Martelella alba TaxID=2590451 RepID=A0A506U1Y9_9HYPH|nr:DUF3955 domain-containing protein [Martelella alba]TPW27466.1 DUF3955 domain-containing protein [Martelella alba]